MIKEIKLKMKVAIYCRASREDQTLEQQLSILKDYCQREGFEIYNVYAEKGISGAKTSRPKLDLMLQDMRANKFGAVVVWKYDRLGRSTIHLLQVLEELQKRKIRLIATSQSIDTSSPTGKLFFTILSGIAELERETVIERTKAKLDYYKKQIEEKGYAVTKKGKRITKLGRPKGSKDKKRRKRGGYYLRYKQSSPLKSS